MSPVVEYNAVKSEVKLALLNDETVIGLRETNKGVIVMQNDEAIVLIAAPIMRVVKGIRLMYPNARFERV